MRYLTRPTLLLIVCVLIAACDSGAQPQALPTLVPDSLATPTDAPTTESITETAQPSATLFVRRTLPPTWTPVDTDTPEPTSTPRIDTPAPTVLNEVPSECNNFTVDTVNSQTTFALGAAPKISWTPVSGAVRYWIIVSDTIGNVLRNDIYVAETSYNLPPELFELGKFYGWTVAPIDSVGQQMCYEVGAELIPFQPR